jgi:hypothetical protein
MAFLNRLAAVPCSEVEVLRGDPNASLSPSLTVSVSHLIAYWVQIQPIGQLLGKAIDGGMPINYALRHQLRDPCYHGPDAVRTLYSQLLLEAQQVNATYSIPPDDWYRIEIDKVLRVFGHAADRGECVVSALEPCNDIHFKSRK